MTKLLLINHDQQSCQMLEQGLKRHDYDVVTATQGAKGLTLAFTESPNLIVIDVEVPVVDGFNVIKFLKESSLTECIPVIAIADRAISAQRLIEAGFNTYVRKPVSLRNLLVRIQVLLDIVNSDAKAKSIERRETE